MSRRDNDGVWASTTQAARWLSQPNTLLRTFLFHLKETGELAGARDYDDTASPKLAVDQQFIYDNWAEWSKAWDRWYAPERDREAGR
ncbi:hypothetical protein OOK13_43800 [Streptomyces sp. NBC_00378]|uniref:hypothetical protein n=1 Tax=unclassified Streptomyces TaxID=2593676 RepID=UPI00224FCB4D|nr:MULTISPECIES: hypothetical protein [unclassified Streptomyces]MCX5115253.1 hypothetical protein [Streptomyces sp. NBC_00378]